MFASAKVVAGVSLQDVFRIVTSEAEVTKYNPDTGVPYQARIQKVKYLLCGNEIAAPREPEPEEWVPRLTGLDVFDAGMVAWGGPGGGWSRFDWGKYVVGRAIATASQSGCSDDEPIDPFTLNDAQKALAEVALLLAALGHKGEPTLHLVCGLS